MAKKNTGEEAKGKSTSSPSAKQGGWVKPLLAAGALLVIVTLASYWGIWSASFVKMDDDMSVAANARVREGLTPGSIKWAFSSNLLGNYIPLAQLSHMLDVEIWGMKAGGHHFTSLLIHILNVLLLLVLLERMTGAVWKSALVAALFAVHPLHVESVAWVAERKDVLSAFFWLACTLAYFFYAKSPSVPKFALVCLLFVMGMLAKPMLLTLPFTLLLLDYWPLRRWPREKSAGGGDDAGAPGGEPATPGGLLAEKSVLFLMVPFFTVVAFVAQRQAEAVASAASLSVWQRVANAAVSYVMYLKMAVFPKGLAVFYPLPKGGVPFAAAAVSFLILIAITAGALFLAKRKKYVLVGWLWYLGTLVPVIGLVQIGSQRMADRYTYLPLTGVFIAAVWGAADLAGRSREARRVMTAAACVVIVALAAMTNVQAGYWRDSFTLLGRALEVTKDNWFVHTNLGYALYEQGRKEEAIAHYRKSVEINPNNLKGLINLGSSLSEAGRDDEAIVFYEEALRIMPENPKAINNLGLVLVNQGRFPEAAERFRDAVRLDPKFFDAWNNLAGALAQAGDMASAEKVYREALKVDPSSAMALNNLGIIVARDGRVGEAAELFRQALKISPGFADARKNLSMAESMLGRHEELPPEKSPK